MGEVVRFTPKPRTSKTFRVYSPVLNDPLGRLYWECRPAVATDALDMPFIERGDRIFVVVGEGRMPPSSCSKS